jgi:hypothetical protein
MKSLEFHPEAALFTPAIEAEKKKQVFYFSRFLPFISRKWQFSSLSFGGRLTFRINLSHQKQIMQMKSLPVYHEKPYPVRFQKNQLLLLTI